MHDEESRKSCDHNGGGDEAGCSEELPALGWFSGRERNGARTVPRLCWLCRMRVGTVLGQQEGKEMGDITKPNSAAFLGVFKRESVGEF